MFASLFSRQPARSDIAPGLYGVIVTQARNPVFYRDLSVPDTVEGRFEMVVLHLALFVRGLRGRGEAAAEMSQAVFDWFCQDMDRTLREMGVGDLSVSKKMRRIGEAFYGRAEAYDKGLDDPDRAGLSASVARNVFDHGTPGVASAAVAAYMVGSDAALRTAPLEALIAGQLPFPDPQGFVRGN
jgi:cytochrome b pre-mRNA-processing protein 3